MSGESPATVSLMEIDEYLVWEFFFLEQHTLVVRMNIWLVEWTFRLSCCCSYLPVVVLLLDSGFQNWSNCTQIQHYSIISKLSLEEGSGLCEFYYNHGHMKHGRNIQYICQFTTHNPWHTVTEWLWTEIVLSICVGGEIKTHKVQQK